jgi:hypothetical protein|tara:strand:- start:134 stop:580 length:447 start_codon:yes stop_codon:yes gene_type:complete
MKEQYKKGDVVVCMGGSQKKGSEFIPSFSVCKVLEVGHQDLVIQEYPEKTFGKVEAVPADTCIKVELPSHIILSSRKLLPQIGDLVYSFPSSRYDRKDSFSGILYSVDYKFGKEQQCQIMCGEDFKTALYETLIVIHTDNEQASDSSV